MTTVQVVRGWGRTEELHDVHELVVDGVRFTPEVLLHLTKAKGQTFIARRDGDVVVFTTLSA